MSRSSTVSQEGVWAKAMREHDFAAILDWFSIYFFSTGAFILITADLAVGFASGWNWGM